ncbi:hypothetical protein ABDD95_07080 [Mucilaginibacter sp. PAMB04274]|uniref:hypothetical protein n=1 Tax=Mucilaginibacter sp. PAMB04274 TaxID=3138568 RepID=UPI0033284586
MTLKIFVVLFLSSGVLTCRAQANFSFSTGVATGTSKLTWSIAGNSEGKSPNILSELKWNRIASAGIFFNSEYRPISFLSGYIKFQQNFIYHGTGTDVDYQGDDRSNPTYDEGFTSSKGSLKNLETGISLTPLELQKVTLQVGIAYLSDTQQLFILNTGFDNLNSTYTASWKGLMPHAGARIDISKRVLLKAVCKYALVNYNATADWNLIETFMHPISFLQHANGQGVTGEVVINVKVSRSCSIFASTTFTHFKTNIGVDESFLQNGNRLLTQFNGAQYRSSALQVGVTIELVHH